MPLPSLIQHHLLEHHPGSAFQLPEILVVPVMLIFQEQREDTPEEDPAHHQDPDNHLTLVAQVEGWPELLIVHPMAGNRPRGGEAWECAVDERGWVWPVERLGRRQ